MHDLIFAVAFIAMVASPAMVATIGGQKEYNPNPDVPASRPVNNGKARAGAPPVRLPARTKAALENHPILTYADVTLPVHNERGLAKR
jgi:hypothetical protein